MVNRLGCNTQNFFKYKPFLFLWGVLALFLLLNGNAFAQTDTEFWFSIPEINRYHQSGTVANPCNDGTPTRLNITTLDKPAVVTISMPANEANFTPIVLNIPANQTERLNLYDYISDVVVSPAQTMENVLANTISSTGIAQPYINRANKGIRITSDNLITVYYEIGAINNKELLTLKGRNALGEKFFVPFQTNYPLFDSYNFTRRQYGSFDIVATHDNTHVRITVPHPIFVFGNVSGLNNRPAGTYNIYLDEGQTAIITPYANRGGGYEYQTSRTVKLEGSMVEVVQNSPGVTKTVAVITKEDMVLSSNSIDYVADQLVPITHIGTSYAVVRGYAQNNGTSASYEHFYVVGTEAATNVEVEFFDGTNVIGTSSFTVGVGLQETVFMPFAAEVATVSSDNPVYVFHQSGVGTQFAGSIIPTISVCTGNFVTSFNRTMKDNFQACPLRPGTTSSGSFDFYLNILVYEGAEDGFRLLKEGVDVTAAELPELLPANAATTFKPLPGTVEPFTRYKYARIKADDIVANVAYRLVNDKNVFHLGVINGAGNGVSATNADAFYGYFSDFNEIVPRVYEDYGEDDSYVGCYGDNVELVAVGGRTFSWTPTKFLDNPNSDRPTAINVTENITYTATISGACALTEEIDFFVTISDPVIAAFTSDVTTGCAPLKVEFTNLSQGHATSQWDLNSDGDFADAFWWEGIDPADPTALIDPFNPPNPGGVLGLEHEIVEDLDGKFTAWFDNNTNDFIDYEVTLKVLSTDGICPKEVKKTIRVYPRITADFALDAASTDGSPNCHPHTAEFTPIVTGEVGRYYWEFDGLNTSYEENPTHTFQNKSTGPQTFFPKLTVTDRWEQCSDDATRSITVQPYFNAIISASYTEDCSPLVNNNTTIRSVSEGAIDTYEWELWRVGDAAPYATSSTATPPAEVFNLENNRDDNQVEQYRLVLRVSYGGCTPSEDEVIFEVYPNPTADITITPPGAPDINCSPLVVNLNASNIRNTDRYQWRVNGVAQITNPEPIIPPLGTYPDDYNAPITLTNFYPNPEDKIITYTATNDFGCSFVSTPQTIEVQPYILAEIVIDPFEICPDHVTGDFNVYITHSSIVADGTFQWTIDGTPEPLGADIGTRTFNYYSPSFTPNADGEIFIDVQLDVYNAAGCNVTRVEQIQVNPPVTVDFDAFIGGLLVDPGVTQICPPVSMNFQSAFTPKDDNISFRHWKFGNIAESNEINPVLQVENPHAASFNMDVTLTATNTYGCSGFRTKTYEIQPEVKAEFSIESVEGCAPYTLVVNAPDNGTDYDWFFSGQDPSGHSPVFTPVGNQTGGIVKETITLTATRGACPPVINNSVEVTIYPEVQAQWTDDLPTVGNEYGNLCSPLDIEFQNTSNLYALSSPIVNNVQWEVFDSADNLVTSSYLQNFTPRLTNPSHITPLNYRVKLTATSEVAIGGCVGEHERVVTVNPTPNANFDATITEICTPMEIEITDLSETIADADYNWVWDSEATATSTGGQNWEVLYDNSTELITNKLITLHLLNEFGCEDYSDYLLEVYPQLSSAINLLSNTRDASCDNDFFSFENQATEGESIREWRWLVHNTTTGTSNTYKTEDFEHTFRNFGLAPHDISITLTAENHLGCTEDATHNITVFPRVVAAQNFDIGDICGGDVDLTLTNSSSNIGSTHGSATPSFIWTFTPNTGDPDITSDGSTPAVLVNTGQVDPVDYTVHFRAQTHWNNYNGITRTCWDETAGNTVRVYPELDPIYDIPPAVCSGLTGATLEFNKNASSSGGGINDVSLQWDFGDGNTRTTGFVDQVTKDFTNLSDADFTTSTKIFATQLATGCTANREVNVIVHPKVESIFTFEIGDVCDYPLPVTFTNAAKYSKQAGVTTQFHWDYGYGGEEDTFNASSPLTHTHAFTNANPNQIVEYDVVFSITQTHPSGRTCANTSTRKIQVYPEMLPSFNLPTTEGCNPLTVSFSNTSTGVNLIRVNGTPWNGQFLWDLGNGTTSNSITPATREYAHTDKTKSLLYDINLTATNPLGCVKTATTSTPRVTVYPWVESSFTVDRIEGCTPLNVTLNNTSVSSTYTYQWNFTGNGSTVSTATSTAAQPGVITFTNPLGAGDVLSIQNPVIDLVTSLNTSVYTVGGGCTKSSTQMVSVFPHVYPNFDATLEGCHPLNINYNNTSNVFGGTGNGKYTWDLGIGVTTNNQSPTQEYQNSSLVANQSYTGRLTSVSEHGCTDFIPFTVTVWPKPQALIELTEYMECSPFNLEIINQSIGKNRGSTLEFTYDYGDGSPVVGPTTNDGNLPHEFSNFNDNIESYTISLYVKTEDGCDDITYQTIQVFPEVTSIFDTDDGNHALCNPFEVDFVNNSRNAWRYYWDFDDGGITSSSFAPSYRFVNNGTVDRVFDVSLTVMSEYDCEHTEILPLTVYAAPIADFAIIPPHQVFPQNGTLSTFEFRNQSRPGGMPASWAHSWTFGDGNTSTSMDQSLSHTYEHWGFRDDDFRYEVTLSIENEKCSDFVAQKLTLLPPEPISIFRADNYRSCSPLVIKFFNDSKFYLTESEATAFEWRLNNADEPFSTEFEPTLTITEPGYYNIGLGVYGDGGEKNYYRTFRVFENPVARFEVMPERVLLPNAKVHFFNLSENANKYVWDFGDGTPKSSEKDPVHIYDELGEYRVSLMAFAEYEHKDDDGNLLIHECIDYDSRFPAVWVEGEGKILFPNAFMPSKLGPNGGYYDEVDYKNEVFHPVADGVIEYRLMIFNRWGEQIFESNDIKIGWDGYYKGKLASQDVYVWRAVGKFSNGELFDVRGNVTLLR